MVSPQCFAFWHVLMCCFPRLTHPRSLGEYMWLCGIIACLLTIEGVKQRTTSSLLSDRNTLGPQHHVLPLSNPHPHTTSPTANCYFRGSPAGPVPKANKTSSPLSWWACRDEYEAKHHSTSRSCLSLYSSLSALIPFVFHLKESWNLSGLFFSFSWLSAYFSGPGVGEKGVIFQKNTRWIAGSWGRSGWEWG